MPNFILSQLSLASTTELDPDFFHISSLLKETEIKVLLTLTFRKLTLMLKCMSSLCPSKNIFNLLLEGYVLFLHETPFLLGTVLYLIYRGAQPTIEASDREKRLMSSNSSYHMAILLSERQYCAHVQCQLGYKASHER